MHRRHTRRNPLNLRSLTNRSTLMTAATIGIGLVAGWMTLPVVSKILPASWQAQIASATGWGKARGLINVAVGILLFSMLKNKRAKEIGIVIAGTGVYDLIAVNLQAQLGLPMLPVSNMALDKLMPAAAGSYGTPGTHATMALAGNPHAVQAIAGSYGPSAYGASYESPFMKAFGDDLDMLMG
jgi:hypothetical protein